MGSFSTHIGDMATAATHVDTVKDQIDGHLGKVANSVEGLTGAVWSGAAKAQFSRIMADWQQQSIKLNNALTGISETLRSNSAGFDSADQDSAAALSRVSTTGPLAL